MNKQEYPADETAGKLIAAGMKLFGEYGFKGTTTRMIAGEAGSNIGSIAYYFGNKKKLYLAIVDHIAGRMREHFNLGVRELDGDQLAGATPDEAYRMLRSLVRDMVRTFVADGESASWLMLVLREQENPTEAFDILYDKVFSIVYGNLGRMLAVLLHLAPQDRRVAVEAHCLIGQVVFFLVGRSSLVRRLGEEGGYSKETVAAVEDVILAHLTCYRQGERYGDAGSGG